MAGIVANIGNLAANDTDNSGIQSSLFGLTLLAIVVPVFSTLRNRNQTFRLRWRTNAVRRAAIPAGFLVIQLISLVRTALGNSVVTTAALYGLAFVTVMFLLYAGVGYVLASRRNMQVYWRYFAWSIVAYGTGGVILSAFGIEGNVSGGGNAAILPSLFGFDVARESLPMFSGLNSTGTVLGAGVVALVCVGGRLKYVIMIPTLIAMALVDARAPFFALAVATMVALMAGRYARMALGVALLLAVGWGVISDIDGLLGSLARTPGDLSTSRVDLWSIAVKELGDWELIHMIGYGAFGQTVSGITRQFSSFFSGDLYEVVTLHNCALQMVFDIGYVGLVWWAAAWIIVLRWAWKWFSGGGSVEARFALMISVYVLVIGLFQSACGYSESDSLFIYVGLLIGAALSFPEGEKGRTADRHLNGRLTTRSGA